MLKTRKSGLLLHPTSLSGPEGLGTLGAEAREFVNYLVTAGQSVWQVLPLGPTGYGDCPYSSFSAFAGNPDLISLEQLVAVGDLKKSNFPPAHHPDDLIYFSHCRQQRAPLLNKAAETFFATDGLRQQKYADFCQRQAAWLNDYSFYRAMRQAQNDKGWQSWPAEVRNRQETALHHWGTRLNAEIRREKYLQFVFFEQWFSLKDYANQRGIQILGDLPIFVAFDSVDVWANRALFHLDDQGKPLVVAGVPPDYFSQTGQLWGNPLYNWQQMATDDYSWWRARLQWNLQQCDLIRIDHFRGFEACWAVPATEKTAVNGSWQAGPGGDFFVKMQEHLGDLPLIAEDLGVITPQVEQLRDRFNLPGMKILQFAFDSGPQNPYLPHHHPQNAVVYTGTHDNTTSLAWWQGLDGRGKQRLRDYLDTPCRDMPWPLIRCALASPARLAVIPMQDLLKLGAKARMNRPGTATGNWNWRLTPDQLDLHAAERLKQLCQMFDRLAEPDSDEK